jgi:hypothetical protein
LSSFFRSFADKAIGEIKNKTGDAVEFGLNRATDTIIAGKDIANSTIIKNGLNVFIKQYGEIKDFSIDTKNRSVSLNIYLKGESGDVIIDIDSYDFLKIDDRYFLKVYKISANRYWIDSILNVFAKEREFPVPAELVLPLKILM